MTKQIHHHFLGNQEKSEKHVFRKSKKYRTLCSVALGTVVTVAVAWGGSVTQADEVASTNPVCGTVRVTENPATKLPEAQPQMGSEQANRLEVTGQSSGAMTVTVPHETVTNVVNQAKAEGVTTVQDKPMDLGNTTFAKETEQQLTKAEADATKQAQAIGQVTATYKADKAT